MTALSAFDLDGFEKLRPSYRVMVKLARWISELRRVGVFYRLAF
ncbi:MAG TPA: hypothetical protein VKP64_14815 [Mycobacteriales bacterium]|nr:hypothetical protein [Mycobacteriales bacterium]